MARCLPGLHMEPRKTTFRSSVDGGSSVFDVDGFMAVPSVLLRFDPLSLFGLRSFLVLIFAFQRAVPGSLESESGFVAGQV